VFCLDVYTLRCPLKCLRKNVFIPPFSLYPDKVPDNSLTRKEVNQLAQRPPWNFPNYLKSVVSLIIDFFALPFVLLSR